MTRSKVATLAVTALVCLIWTLAAGAQTTASQMIDLTGLTISNPCNGDVITLSGSMHIDTTTTSDGAGGYHLRMANNAAGISGTGTSGAAYRYVNTSNFMVNAQPPYPYEFTLPATMKVVGTGTTANFTNRLLFKATTNADGEVTYSFFGGESTCQ